MLTEPSLFDDAAEHSAASTQSMGRAQNVDSAISLVTPLSEVLAPRIAKQLEAFDLHTVNDLLRYHPRKYADPGKQLAIEQLDVGEYVSVFGEVVSAQVLANANGGYRLVAAITDGAHQLALTFFGKSREKLAYRLKELTPGAQGIFTGTVSRFNSTQQLTHPNYSLVSDAESESDVKLQATKPIPLYRANAKTPTWVIQAAITDVLNRLDPGLILDPIPSIILQTENLTPLTTAFEYLHRPENESQWQAARDRFRFEEALVLQAALAKKRQQEAKTTKRRLLPIPSLDTPLDDLGVTKVVGLLSIEEVPGERERQAKPAPGAVSKPRENAKQSRLQKFDAQLPFQLTAGQKRIGDILSNDLSQNVPMQRLLVGEVGSGKTVIALRAMLQAIDAGAQAVLIAPTEILAQQHARSIAKLLGPMAKPGPFAAAPEVSVELLTGSSVTAARRKALLSTISGEPVLLVGTHALLEDNVKFFDLGLVVVDEQQRFGVEQRDKLRAKGNNPHLLVMTATPIPRTIALTAFGDLDVVELRDMPPGRQPIQSYVVHTDNKRWVERTWQRVAEEVKQGHRVFVVCPRIIESEESDLASVNKVMAELRANPVLAGIPVEAIHGQMKANEKDAVMQRFASGETPLVVATTVIEVGVDIPEATVMVVLDADRFGISQLHQLRGRIGRGKDPGLCLLMTAAHPESTGGQRVAAVAETNDGFILAQTDLNMRAEGDVLGTKQSGRNSSLKLLRVAQDGEILEKARIYASDLLKVDPDLKTHPALNEAITTLSETQQANLVKS